VFHRRHVDPCCRTRRGRAHHVTDADGARAQRPLTAVMSARVRLPVRADPSRDADAAGFERSSGFQHWDAFRSRAYLIALAVRADIELSRFLNQLRASGAEHSVAQGGGTGRKG